MGPGGGGDVGAAQVKISANLRPEALLKMLFAVDVFPHGRYATHLFEGFL